MCYPILLADCPLDYGFLDLFPFTPFIKHWNSRMWWQWTEHVYYSILPTCIIYCYKELNSEEGSILLQQCHISQNNPDTSKKTFKKKIIFTVNMIRKFIWWSPWIAYFCCCQTITNNWQKYLNNKHVSTPTKIFI